MTGVASGRVPILDCFKASWRFLADTWRMFLPAAGALTAVSVVANLTLGVAPAAGVAAATAPAFGPTLAAMVPLTIAGIVFNAAVLRKAVRNEFHGPGGLGFGADELRLLGVLASLALLILPPTVLIAVVFGVVVLGRVNAEEVAATQGNPEETARVLIEALGAGGVAALYLGFFLVLGVLIYVSARLSMVNAASIGEKRMVFLQTWSWSKGNAYRIILVTLLTALPAYAVVAVLQALMAPLAASGAAAALAIDAVLTFVAAMLNIPQIALGAELYRGLKPPGFVAK